MRDGKLPADLLSAIQHQKTSHAMYTSEPGLEMISLQGKYDPFRTALFGAWQSSCSAVKKKGAASLEQRAEVMLNILEKTLDQLSEVPMQEWHDNCGRNVSHVLGWLPLLARLDVLQVQTRKRPYEAVDCPEDDVVRRCQKRPARHISSTSSAVKKSSCSAVQLAGARPLTQGPTSRARRTQQHQAACQPDSSRQSVQQRIN